jgi:toxic protein SymE
MKIQWREAVGSLRATKVEARVIAGCIVLTAIEPESEREEAMSQIEKLPARKQNKVSG